MEIRVILDPAEVRELLEKTGSVVIKPTAANTMVDARADRRGRPAANPPAVIPPKAKPQAVKAEKPVVEEEAPAAAVVEEKVKQPAKARTQVEVQTALAAHAKKFGREPTLEKLNKYGKNVAEVKVEDYQALIDDLTGETSEAGDEW